MNKLRKTFAAITAMLCILSAASCSMKEKIDGIVNDNSSGKNNSQTADKVMDKSYSAVEIDADIPLEYISSIYVLGDTGKILFSGGVNGDDGYRSATYVTDTEFLTFDEITYELPQADNIESYTQTAVTSDGTIFLLATITDYGDAEMPDYDDPDFDYENFDYDAMWESAEITYKLVSMDADGNVLSECDIEGVEKYSGDNLYSSINEFYALGEDKVLVSIYSDDGSTCLAIDKDGKLSDPIDFGDDEYFYPAGNDINGNFVYTTYVDGGNVVRTLDASTLTLSPNDIKLKESDSNDSYINRIFRGNGEYTVFLSGERSLSGLKADGTLEEIINWTDSDINGSYVEGFFPLEDGDYAVYERDWSMGTTRISRLTKRDPSELANTQIINIVVNYTDDILSRAIKEFNQSNTEYRIRVEDYSKYYEWDEDSQQSVNTPEKQLRQDIATGKSFDMIYMYDNALIKNLASKGALVDLYDLMGTDGTVSKEDIVDPVLKAGEVNGKLASISKSFNINTLACKTKYCDIENWTLDDMIETYDSLPDDMQLFFPSTKTSVFDSMQTFWQSLIDYEKGKCDFNNPEFIKLLEFCNQFSNEGEGDDINWETATDEEMQEYWENQETANLNDKALLRNVYFYDVREYARTAQGYFGDDITLVGYPSLDGHGAKISNGTSISIMANSQYKDVCWKFISSMFDEDYESAYYMSGFPALKSSFEKKLDDSMKKPYYTDENGKKVEYDDMLYIGGKSVAIKPLTQEQRDYLEEYILNADTHSSFYDNDIWTIIHEEVEVYFAGEKSAEETASIIQNRASILISEQS